MNVDHIIELLDTLTAPELRRVLTRAQELDAQYTEWQDPNYTPGPTPGDGRTYRQEWTRCNKTGCKSCAELGGHSPYWYAYWREDTKLKKKYIGKELVFANQLIRDMEQMKAAAQSPVDQLIKDMEQMKAAAQSPVDQLVKDMNQMKAAAQSPVDQLVKDMNQMKAAAQSPVDQLVEDMNQMKAATQFQTGQLPTNQNPSHRGPRRPRKR